MNKFLIGLCVLMLSISVHGHEKEDINPAVGPEKGITEANEKDGFKLSKEAKDKFGITSQRFDGAKSISIPRSALFIGLRETNLFRLRDGFFKRIDFTFVSKSSAQVTVSSAELRPGDEIVTSGVGFLRIVELQASGDIADEH